MSEYAIQRLVTNVLTQCPGALIGTIQLEIFNAVATFCKESNVWQETQNFNTKVGKQVYEITAETQDAYVSKLLNLVAFDPSDPTGETTTPTPVAAWLDASATGLVLKLVPTEVQRLRGTFAIVPKATDQMDQYPGIPE